MGMLNPTHSLTHSLTHCPSVSVSSITQKALTNFGDIFGSSVVCDYQELVTHSGGDPDHITLGIALQLPWRREVCALKSA